MCGQLKGMTADTEMHVVFLFTQVGKYLNSESLNIKYKH